MKNLFSHSTGCRSLYLAVLLAISAISCTSSSKHVKQLENPKSAQTVTGWSDGKLDPRSPMDVVAKEAQLLFLANKFDDLDSLANRARENKERLAGGYWKIDGIHRGVERIYTGHPGQKISDDIWEARIAHLKRWKEQSPASLSARVAIAGAYIEYAWFARGVGTIDTVTKNGYTRFHERLDLAEQELAGAATLGISCPLMYQHLLYIGLMKGWSPQDFELLYQKAVRSEPNYLRFYILKSDYLMPKWHGKPGDLKLFIDALPGATASYGSSEVDILYFVVLGNVLRDGSVGLNWAMVSKERIRNGFQMLEKRYGVDGYRINQFAYLASVTLDHESANETFERIGNDWDPEIWRSESTFKMMKQLAKSGPGASKANTVE